MKNLIFYTFLFLIFTINAQLPELNRDWHFPSDDNIFTSSVNEDNDMLFIAGDFENIGYPATNAMVFNNTNGLPDLNFPSPNSTVSVIIPDNSGGWFLGGSFTKIGEITRNRLAHVDASGNVMSFDVSVNGHIRSLYLEGSTLFIGGLFTQVNGQSANGFAGVDIFTGAVLNYPSTNLGGTVLSIVSENGYLYLGGIFNTFGGFSRSNIAKIELISGSVDTWAPTINGEVISLGFNGGIIYIGGSFTQVNGVSRQRLAGLDPNTAVLSPFNVSINSFVSSFDFVNNDIFLVGAFTQVDGQSRNYAASINLLTYNINTWNPNLSSAASKVMHNGGQIYLTGTFQSVGATPRTYAASVDIISGVVTSWEPSIGSPSVSAIAIQNNQVYLGGSFVTLNTENRSKVAALDLATGNLLSWNCGNINGTVYSLDYYNGILYIGGDFTEVNGESRNGIAALDALDGSLLSWNPNCNGTVYSIVAGDLRVYVGGDFSNIGGSNRNNLAVLRPTDGTAIAWNPNVNGTVYSIVVDINTIYFGGLFTSVGGLARNNIGAVDLLFGNAISTFAHNVDNSVYTLIKRGDSLIFGGTFNNVNGQNTGPLVILNVSSNSILYSNIAIENSSVYSIKEKNNMLYVGGLFSFFYNFSFRENFYEMDLADLVISDWDPSPNSTIRTISFWDNSISLGGEFLNCDSYNIQKLAVFDQLCTPADITTLTSSQNNICPSESVTLTILNGQLNNANNWQWYEGSCAGSQLAQGTETSVNPSSTTTYFVRGEGGCVSNLVCSSITITVEDNELPTISAPSDITVSNNLNECYADNLTLGSASASDNCAIQSVSNDAPTIFPVGTTIVTWTAIDIMGNSATDQQIIEVIDNELPSLVLPVNITENAENGTCSNSIVNIGNATASDNCGIQSIENNAPSIFPVGTTIVEWTATDVNGNSITLPQTIVIIDNELPVIIAPSDLIISTDNNDCIATNVSLGIPVSSDNCGVSNISNNAPTQFPLGMTTITWTVTDLNGNTNQVFQQITVQDNEAPTLSAPSDVTLFTDIGACEATSLPIGAPSFSDNCTIDSVWNDLPNSLPIGIHTVNWFAVDLSGNIVSDTQIIEIIDDEDPEIIAPNDILEIASTGQCGKEITNLGTPVASDNCSVFSITNDAPLFFPVGETIVVWTVTDASGNNSTSTQLINIVDEESPEIINCPSIINSCDPIVFWDTITATDNCSLNLTATTSHFSGSIFPVGSTIVTYVVEDEFDNVEICSFEVIVFDSIPSSEFNLTPSPITTGNDGEIILTSTNSLSNYTFEWSGPNGFNSSSQNLTNLSLPGSYSLVITDSNGCTIELFVFLDSHVNLGSNEKLDIKIYPNPAANKLFVDSKLDIDYMIFDINGRLLLKGDSKEIDLTSISSGVYSIQINSSSSMVKKKFVVL